MEKARFFNGKPKRSAFVDFQRITLKKTLKFQRFSIVFNEISVVFQSISSGFLQWLNANQAKKGADFFDRGWDGMDADGRDQGRGIGTGMDGIRMMDLTANGREWARIKKRERCSRIDEGRLC